MDQIKIWAPRTLVIGPGGVKGLKTLGFLCPLEDYGLLDTMDTFCGVSIGALISLLIICGYEMREIIGEATRMDFFKDIGNFNFQSIIENKGLISNEPVRKKLTELVLNKFGTIPNLYQLYMRTGKALTTVTLNATDKISVMMNPFTHGDVSCVDAVLYSMNIPFLFYQLVYQGKIYVDGAFADPYPIEFFDDTKTDILGIYMKSKTNEEVPFPPKDDYNSTYNHLSNKILKRIEPVDPPENECERCSDILPVHQYVTKMVEYMLEQRRISAIYASSNKCVHVCIEANSNDPIGYKFSTKEKAKMLSEGYVDGKEFLNKICKYNFSCDLPEKIPYKYPPYYTLDDNI